MAEKKHERVWIRLKSVFGDFLGEEMELFIEK